MDYLKLGMKCGLEVHQQLDTKKLFCECPSVLRSDAPDFVVKRKLHAVAGESGEIDVAAKYATEQNKEFVYEVYDTNCLVELDEEPPHQINLDALKIALQISILLNAKIIPLTQIMRKTVVDGSNTGGFQRTVLVAYGGFVETNLGRVKIESICLEEDSARKVSESSYICSPTQSLHKSSSLRCGCSPTPSLHIEEDSARIVSREKNKVVYRLDRLGIPLIEIATAPDIKTPEQAKEVALHIGDILRSCEVKRGIGTIRQDVNLSIRKGKRVEIKGFQDIRNIERAIEIEIERQKKLVEEGKSVNEVRNVLPDGKTEFLRPMPGAARMYPETDLPLLKISRKMIDNAKKNLPKLKKEVEDELIKKGLNHDMIKLLFKQNKLEVFKEFLKILNNPQLIAKILLMYPKEISKREKVPVEKIEVILEENLIDILEKMNNKKISESQIKPLLEKLVRGEALEKISFEKEDVNVVEERIIKLIKERPGLNINAYMGLVMKEFKDKISGKEAMEIIEKYLK